MRELVFLLEEESAKAMLLGVLPRVLDPKVQPRLMVFEGKQDLEKQMVKRLRGYVNPHARFIVLRDQDSAPDCKVVKAARHQHSARFRLPDAMENPSHELARLTQGAYQKVSGSRQLGPHLDLANARSPSFRNLIAGVRRLERELLALPESP